MTKEELKKVNIELVKIQKEYTKYLNLFKEDGAITSEEKETLRRIKNKIKILKAYYSEKINEISKIDDPIVKQINYELYLSLETFIYVKVWDLNKGKEKPYFTKKIELESESDFPTIEIPSYSEVEISTWAKASFIDANIFADPYVEILQKDYFALIKVDKKGNYSLIDTNEKTNIHNSKVLSDYDVSLNIEYIKNGQQIRVHADGFATGKVVEKEYKNWDTKTIKEKAEFKDKVLKSIAPTLKLKALKYIAPPPVSKELIFESENQAILSCDQLRVLHKWWDSLQQELKNKVENREAYIKVIGYTTTTGNDRYNDKLGEQRALDVKKLLDTIIGKKSETEGVADIRYSSKGEISDDPDRYVKILVIVR
ncbi:OmpA family protein [Aureispira sp. CCB-QB1]|uniref:OmpA family protein n=1 Tax=Aureispira sp. CCB-QB1 TaxID=1313421 RepID=UPI0006991F61|nr:OmpA family protein [Aureispira sp. CCB-QB1]